MTPERKDELYAMFQQGNINPRQMMDTVERETRYAALTEAVHAICQLREEAFVDEYDDCIRAIERLRDGG